MPTRSHPDCITTAANVAAWPVVYAWGRSDEKTGVNVIVRGNVMWGWRSGGGSGGGGGGGGGGVAGQTDGSRVERMWGFGW